MKAQENDNGLGRICNYKACHCICCKMCGDNFFKLAWKLVLDSGTTIGASSQNLNSSDACRLCYADQTKTESHLSVKVVLKISPNFYILAAVCPQIVVFSCFVPMALTGLKRFSRFYKTSTGLYITQSSAFNTVQASLPM